MELGIFRKFDMQGEQKKKFSVAGITFIVIAIFIVVFAVGTLIMRAGKIKIHVQFYPEAAEVYVDGSNKNINGKDVYLSEGNHKFEAYLDGYLYSSNEININKYVTEVVRDLSSVDTIIGMGIGGNDANNSVIYTEGYYADRQAQLKLKEELSKEYPIIKYLPYSSETFSITPQFNEDYSELTVQVKLLKNENDVFAMINAKRVMESFEMDTPLSSYNIVYSNAENPFVDKCTDTTGSSVDELLQKCYGNIKNVEIANGERDGDYYYTVIWRDVETSGTPSVYHMAYRVVVRRDGERWKLAGVPNIILTVYNTLDVPVAVLDLANNYEAVRDK